MIDEDEDPCTDCHGSGITLQTERPCSCDDGEKLRRRNEFAPAEIAAITLLRRAGRKLPDDLFAVGALQELACLYVKIEPLLTEPMKATFIGAGAYVARQAEAEMKASVEAITALANLGAGKPST